MTEHYIRTIADLEVQEAVCRRNLENIDSEIKRLRILHNTARKFVKLFDISEIATDAMVLPVLYGDSAYAALADIITVSRDAPNKQMIYSFNINGFKSDVAADRVGYAVAELLDRHL